MQEREVHEEIVHLLKEMKREYEYMAGDYDFVDAVTQWALQLTDDKKQLLLESLFELFKSDDPLGAYFCDVLVNLRETDFAPRLMALLPSPQAATPKSIEVVRTMIRLEYKQGIPTYLNYIQTLLQHNDLKAFTLLCHLYIVDPDIAIQESAKHFAKVLDASITASDVSAYIPCFVHIYCKQTPSDILRLIQFTKLQGIEAGRQLANLFLQAISRPYEREKFAGNDLMLLEQELSLLST